MKVEFLEKKFIQIKKDALVLVVTKEDVSQGKDPREKASRLFSVFPDHTTQLEAALRGTPSVAIRENN